MNQFVELGQHQIEDDEVGQTGAGEVDGCRAVVRANHIITRPFEVASHVAGERRLVINHERAQRVHDRTFRTFGPHAARRPVAQRSQAQITISERNCVDIVKKPLPARAPRLPRGQEPG